MGRSIDSFKGKYAIICGSRATEVYLDKRHSPDNYYSFSYGTKNRNIDSKLTITTEKLNERLKARFDIVYLENLHYSFYNNSTEREKTSLLFQTKGAKGFANACAMTTKDGFIVIKGCPRQKEFRKSLQNLNYVEFSEDCVIIPNDQSISIETFNETIAANSEMIRLLRQLNEHYVPSQPKFVFCNVSYSALPSFNDFRELCGNPSADNEKLNETELALISAHKKMAHVAPLYKAIDSLARLVLPAFDDKLGSVIARFTVKLAHEADLFFKYPTSVIYNDIPVFKGLLSDLINKFNTEYADIPEKYKTALSDISRALEQVSFQSGEDFQPKQNSICCIQ